MMEELGQRLERRGDPVSLKDFTRARTVDLFMHFFPNDIGDHYRDNDYYKEFEKERPDLAKKLLINFSHLKDQEHGASGIEASEQEKESFKKAAERNQRVFEANKEDLYDAYLVMRQFIRGDNDLLND